MLLTTHAGPVPSRLLELSTAATHSVSKSWQGLSNLGRDCWLHAWQSSLLREEGELNLTRSSAGFLHSHIELLRCSLYRTTLESAVKLPADKSDCCLLAKGLFIPGSWWSPRYSWTGHSAGNKAPIATWPHARARGTLRQGSAEAWGHVPGRNLPTAEVSIARGSTTTLAGAAGCTIMGSGGTSWTDPTRVVRRGNWTASWGFGSHPGHKELVV